MGYPISCVCARSCMFGEKQFFFKFLEQKGKRKLYKADRTEKSLYINK